MPPNRNRRVVTSGHDVRDTSGHEQVYKRIMVGVSVTPQIFQSELGQFLSELEDAWNFQDDRLVFGGTKEEQDMTLKRVLDEFNDVTFELEKCLFGVQDVEVLEQEFTVWAYVPNQRRISNLTACRVPISRQELSSFLGLIGYVAHLTSDCSTKTFLLRELNTTKGDFIWTDQHDVAFESLRQAASNITAQAFFNPDL